MAGEAKCRAGWTQHVLRSARELTGPSARDFGCHIDAAHLVAIERAPSIGWIPFSAHMAVLVACRGALGRRGYRDFSRLLVARALDNPMLFAKQIMFAAQSLDGGPLGIYRVLPVAIRQIFRSAGEVEVQLQERSAVVVYQGLPSAHASGDAWSLIWLGTLEAVAERALRDTGLSADIEQRAVEVGRGRFEWHAILRKQSSPR
jgi:hypothetical protein